MEQHSIARLIGSPPGYVGHDEGGQLTEAVRRRPYCVVLLDEIEKAHPRVLNVLLQMLDDGRLTDSKGRTVNFTSAVVIMTTNLGAEALLDGRPWADAQKAVHASINRHFPPELVNRLDDIIVFSPLGTDNLAAIIRHNLKLVSKRMADRDVVVQATDAACEYIVTVAHDSRMGARPIRRYVEKEIVTELSRLILSSQLPPHSLVELDVDESGTSLKFQVTRRAAARDGGGDVMDDGEAKRLKLSSDSDDASDCEMS
eukprot:scaffold25591_cov41-Prasinocladus_malaysianus.AAC.1